MAQSYDRLAGDDGNHCVDDGVGVRNQTQSKGSWDVYKVLSTIKPTDA